MDKMKFIREVRFWSKVNVSRNSRDCWEWQGMFGSEGYGLYCEEGAHRHAYRRAWGKIPNGLVVRHKCDNPACCNPFHLELGTHQDNRVDCIKRSRHAKGIAHGGCKYSDETVAAVIGESSDLTHQQIADKYGISRPSVTRIRNGKQRVGKKAAGRTLDGRTWDEMPEGLA